MNREELERRTLEFSKNLIRVLNKLPKNLINNKLIPQAVSSGTSIGANYREANASESEKDFKHKINISFKEAKETKYWLDILISANPTYIKELTPLRQESDELSRIFGKAVSTCNAKCKIQECKMRMRNQKCEMRNNFSAFLLKLQKLNDHLGYFSAGQVSPGSIGTIIKTNENIVLFGKIYIFHVPGVLNGVFKGNSDLR